MLSAARPSSRTRVFPAQPRALFDVRTFLRELCREEGVDGGAADDIVLAVSEACANAVVHSGSAVFRVGWRIRPDRVEVSIGDQGRFVRKVPLPELEGQGGHGIPLMTALMDEVSVRRGTSRRGTEVRLTKRLERVGTRAALRPAGTPART